MQFEREVIIPPVEHQLDQLEYQAPECIDIVSLLNIII